jgi:Ca2+-transporting ATPase
MLNAHTHSGEKVAESLSVTPNRGLNDDEVVVKQASQGLNVLPKPSARPAWLRIFDQLKSPLIIVLLLAASLAAMVGNLKDATVIIAVVILNSALGFYQEYRAERSLAALKGMLPAKARVRRNGTTREVDASSLVTGDIVLLEAGEQVPADGRLFESAGLAIDESSLTGESLPAPKDAASVAELEAPLSDRANMAFMNTLVARGRGELIVTAIGGDTATGRISIELAQTEGVRSPLQNQLDTLRRRLGGIALTLVAVLGFLEYLRSIDLVHALLDAIALAVAAVPEGLPAVVTVTLAIGMQQMARHKAIVKRLTSVETLGCTTVICTDKTGTLTLNQMTVRAVLFQGKRFTVTGEGYLADGKIVLEDDPATETNLRPLLEAVTLCNDSHLEDGNVIGDPMEGALHVLAGKGGVKAHRLIEDLPRISEIPFDAEHKFMATFHEDNEQVHIFVKGAPDVLLARCTRQLFRDGDMPLDDRATAAIENEYRAMAEKALRGLLVASRTVPVDDARNAQDLAALVADLTFLGLVGLMDPPRPEVKDAIGQCKSAGIEIKMITGDHRDTALAIARELGLEGDAMTGAELEVIDALDLSDRLENLTVFARVAPEHKVKIVRTLQSKGHVVAMTGDGVNDAPALRFADIGVAMGISGTAVSKEAATMVLTDDNFATMVRAVHQGRALYDNIVKFIRFQMSTTVGAILTVFFVPLAGLPEVFTPLQILWVAMIMDGPPAVSLALDSPRPGLMQDPPRSRDLPLLPFQRLVKIVMFGLTMMVGTLSVLYYSIAWGDEARAVTLAFTTFVLFQFFNIFNARVEEGSAFNARFFDNKMLWWSLGAVVTLQVVAVSWAPLRSLFHVTPLTVKDWLIAIAVASSVLLLEEARKLGLRVVKACLPDLRN